MKLILTEQQLKTLLTELSPIAKVWSVIRTFKKLESIDDAIIMLKKLPDMIKTFDDIFVNAAKIRNISELETLQVQMIQAINPSDVPDMIRYSQEQTGKILNGYARMKGFQHWDELKAAAAEGKTRKVIASAVPDLFAGNRISNRSFEGIWKFYINWDDITYVKNMEDYNKIIANAISTGNYGAISRKGFEKFGITDFREYLKNNIIKVNDLDPMSGRWSVNFK